MELTLTVDEKYYCSIFSSFNVSNHNFSSIEDVVDDIVNNIDNLKSFGESLGIFDINGGILETLLKYNPENSDEIIGKFLPHIIKTIHINKPTTKQLIELGLPDSSLTQQSDYQTEESYNLFGRILLTSKEAVPGNELIQMVKTHPNFNSNIEKLKEIQEAETAEIIKQQNQDKFIVRQNQYKQYQLLKKKLDAGEFDDVK